MINCWNACFSSRSLVNLHKTPCLRLYVPDHLISHIKTVLALVMCARRSVFLENLLFFTFVLQSILFRFSHNHLYLTEKSLLHFHTLFFRLNHVKSWRFLSRTQRSCAEMLLTRESRKMLASRWFSNKVSHSAVIDVREPFFAGSQQITSRSMFKPRCQQICPHRSWSWHSRTRWLRCDSLRTTRLWCIGATTSSLGVSTRIRITRTWSQDELSRVPAWKLTQQRLSANISDTTSLNHVLLSKLSSLTQIFSAEMVITTFRKEEPFTLDTWSTYSLSWPENCPILSVACTLKAFLWSALWFSIWRKYSLSCHSWSQESWKLLAFAERRDWITAISLKSLVPNSGSAREWLFWRIWWQSSQSTFTTLKAP